MIKLNKAVKVLQTLKLSQRFSEDHHQEIDHRKLLLRDQKSGYYMDPNEVTRRMMRIIALHDSIKAPEAMTLNSQWHELGVNQMDYVEIMIGVEDEFQMEFPDDVTEKFKDIHDCVQYVSRSYWAA